MYIEESALGIIIIILIAIPLSITIQIIGRLLLDKLFGGKDYFNRGDSC